MLRDRCTGSSFHITVLMSVKSAVLAPMPIASESTAASGEPRALRERAQRVAEVLAGLLEPRPSPLGARVFGGERQVAELAGSAIAAIDRSSSCMSRSAARRRQGSR